MAERPIFLPSNDTEQLVTEVFLSLHWHSGFAAVQKEKNIRELHSSAKTAGFGPLLEISTKSEKTTGRHLSAFHLKVKTDSAIIPLECAFQGSKVFEYGGPYVDLYAKDVREAKRDSRLKDSGKLIGFEFGGRSFSLEPKTFFYDWLYLNAIYEHRDWLERLNYYAGFTDIEFNPYRSINCQARSIALFLTLQKRDLLGDALQSPETFVTLLNQFHYRPDLRAEQPSPPQVSMMRRQAIKSKAPNRTEEPATLHFAQHIDI